MILVAIIVLIILLTITSIALGYTFGRNNILVEKIQDMRSKIASMRRKK